MKRLKNFLVVLALMTAAWRLDASTVVQLSFDQLSRAANTVVAGEVIKITASREANGYIYSTVTVRVAEAVPQTLVGTDYTFRMLGGEVGDQSMAIQGMPKFTAGEGIILFLNDSPDGMMGPTVGLWQGIFHVDAASAVSDHERQLVMGVKESQLLRAAPSVEADLPGVEASEVTAQRSMNVSGFMDAVRQARAAK